MATRRPTSIPGMLLHLARLRGVRAGHLGLGALGLAAALGAASMRPAPPQTPTATSPRRAPQTRDARPLGLGACAATGMVCVADSTCGRGDRCVDVRDLRGLVARVRGPGARDEEVPIFPSLTWHGDGYAAAWSGLSEESAEVWFARASATGERVGAPVRLTRSPSVKVLPSVAASPAGYAVAWTDLRDDDVSVWMLRLDRAGAPQGEPFRLPAPGGIDLFSRVVWNGHEYAVLWYHLTSGTDVSVRMTRVAPDGTRVGGEKVVATNTIPTGAPALAWMGDAYGAAWSSIAPRGTEGATWFARVGAGGEASTPLRVSAVRGQNGGTALAWAKDHFGLAWEDDLVLEDEDAPISRLAFAGVTPTSVTVPRRELTQRDAYYAQPSLVWSGAAYGLAWSRVGSDGADVFFGRLDARGAMQGAPLRLTAGALGLFPALAWSGSEYAAVWTHLGARGFQLRFARLDTNGRRVGSDTVLASH